MSTDRPLWQQVLRFLAIGLASIVTIGVIVVFGASLTGESDWERAERDLRARGEKLTLAELQPPPVPDEENFFGDSMWLELADTKLVEDSMWGPTRQPRLPAEKRQIAQVFEAPVSPGLVERAEEFLKPLKDSPATLNTALLLCQKLERETDPERARAIAQVVLDIHAPGEPFRRRLNSLFDRPHAQFPGAWKIEFPPNIVHLSEIIHLARLQDQLAAANLALDRPDAAARDILVILRIAGTLRDEHLLISFLVRQSVLSFALHRIAKGIERHRWTAENLAAFESALGEVDLAWSLAQALRGERGFFNTVFDQFRNDPKGAREKMRLVVGHAVPTSWQLDAIVAIYRVQAPSDQALHNRRTQETIDVLEGPVGVDPTALPSIPDDFLFRFRHAVVSALASSLDSTIQRALFNQNWILQTRIACALERCRLAEGSYPETLHELVPGFVPAIPADAIAGQSFRYRRTDDGFLLWSPGWNRKDENALLEPVRYKFDSGDWIWGRMPGWKPQ